MNLGLCFSMDEQFERGIHDLKFSSSLLISDMIELSGSFLGCSEIIDDLTHLVDKTDSRIRNESRRVKLVETKSSSCGMLVVIVLLLIAIVVVAVWPTS
ncbi:hypothetical protein Z043_101850 [Scleropages formosus]|uniref:t-SNARE coiled-coil homology domain-containing protein n=1 Tax=Scleropages formosus TaxID=113540 RepID=A0A0P7XP54_SCLFO|nr:hypothetical protein Z043_101850 [Scleropages formosus]